MSLYGCHNRAPFEKTVALKANYNISVEGHHVVCDAVELIPFVFTKTCVYTTSELGQKDAKCVGCTWRKEE